MASRLDRKVNQHFVAARNVLRLAKMQSDKSIELALCASSLFHLELAIAYYLHELRQASGDIIAAPLNAQSFASIDPINAAQQELVSVFNRPGSPLIRLIEWLGALRTLANDGSNELVAHIFESDFRQQDASSELIFSDKSGSQNSGQKDYKAININDIGLVLEELVELVERQRQSAGEY